MKKSTLTQKKLDKLDKISKDSGYELFLPPSKVTHHPFFIMDEDAEIEEVIASLAKGKFIYSVTKSGTKKYISIKG